MKKFFTIFFDEDKGDGAPGAGSAEPTTPPKEEKTFTQAELNDIVSKSEKKALEKLAKDLGVDDFKDAKEAVKKVRDLNESQKTELQKALDRIAELEKTSAEATTTAQKETAKVLTLSKGVPVERVDKVVKLAISGDYAGETLEEKIAAVLADFPEFIKAPEGSKGPAFGNKTENQAPSEQQKIADQFGKALRM